MDTLLVATTNPGKLREIRQLMSAVPIRLVSLADLPPIEEPDETGTTFEENARLKAHHYSARSGLWTVAEDSGLVIDALNGEPGVKSARFLRPDATYPDRFAEIYRRIDAQRDPPRTARFVAAVATVTNGKVIYETTGVVEGTIAEAPRGTDGLFSVRHPESGRGHQRSGSSRAGRVGRSVLRLVRKEMHRPAWQVQLVRSEWLAPDRTA